MAVAADLNLNDRSVTMLKDRMVPSYLNRKYNLHYCGISTDCSAVVTCDSLEQMEGVFEIGVTV